MKRAYRVVVDTDNLRGCRFLKKSQDFTAVYFFYGRFSLLIFELLAFISKDYIQEIQMFDWFTH